MSATVLSFWRPRPANRDWSQQELAEFYRVEAALMQAGLRVETERGLSDEGEPWFVFCRADDSEVVIHFARIDGEYVVAGVLQDGVARGQDFPALVAGLIARHPAVRPEAAPKSNVIMHPATMLVALVAAALLKTGEAKAHAADDDAAPRERGATVPASPSAGVGKTGGIGTHFAVLFEPAHAAAIIAAASYALAASLEQKGESSAPALHAATAAASTFDPSHYMSAPARSAGTYGLDEQPAMSLAALDGTMPPPPAAEVHSASPPATGADAAKLLSLVAVLWTLPATIPSDHEAALTPAKAAEILGMSLQADARPARGAAAPAPALTAQPIVGESGKGETAAQHDGEAAMGKALLVLDMARSSTPLPDVIAVKLALAHEGAATAAVVSVTHSDQLPEVLAKLVSPAANGSPAATPADHALERDAVPSPPAATAAPDPVPAPPETASAPADTRPTGATVQKAIDAFKAATPHHQVHVDGGDVIFYDLDALLHRSQDVRTEKWSFADGSSISLVGLGLEQFHHYALT